MATRPLATHDVVPSWVVLPLRAFLGFTFVYAGLQKLADPNFFAAGASSSIQTQLRGAARTSPIGGLLGPLHHVAVPVGVLIAIGELAVGVGTLVGLWSRAAAAGGLLLSLGFLLAVSWHSNPYYLGPDIVFCFAWTPLLLAPPQPWTVDRWLERRARAEYGLAPVEQVGIPFGTVQRLCGHYDEGRCRARRGAPCSPEPCPVLATPARAHRSGSEVDLERRELLARARLAGYAALPVLVAGGLAAAVGRALNHGRHGPSTPSLNAASGPASSATAPSTGAPSNGSSSTGPPSTAAPAGGGVKLGPVSAVPVGGAARFTDPQTGDPGYVVQPHSGQLKAFSAVCTHQGCTVGYSSGERFVCPCHGAEFDATTGQVLQGPARRPLQSIPVQVRSGEVYLI